MTQVHSLYTPHAHQGAVHAGLKRFSVLVCHRRFGKTVLSINALIIAAARCQKPNPRFAYFAPLYRQAKAVAWDYLRYYAGNIPGVKFNESELRCDLPNGARVTLLGSDNPDSQRGIYLDGVVLDEVAQMPMRMWTEILRPALSDRKGWALFIGTPQGRDEFCALYERAMGDPEWYAAMFRASDTNIIDPDELAALRREMDPDEYEQELECSFSAAIKGAYYSRYLDQAERDGRICNVPYEPILPVYTAWDLGVSDSTSIWFFQVERGGAFRVIDYYEAGGEGLPHYAQVLTDKGYNYAGHIAPHDIAVRELGSGKSRLETARELGIRFDTAPNLPIADGIQAVRNVLTKAWFDREKCSVGLEALRHYRREFNDKMGDFKAHPLHDWTSHAADAFRYLAVGNRQRSLSAVNANRPTHTNNRFSLRRAS